MRSIRCEATSPLDFDGVIAAISKRFPGTNVIEPDWYAKRYSEDLAVADRLGWPAANPVSQSTLRVWQEKGLQRGIQVPIAPHIVLYGRLDNTGGYFFCREGEFATEDVQALLGILRQFDLAVEH